MNMNRNDFFRQVTLKISSSLNIEVAMFRCLDYLKKILPVDEMYMSIYEQNLGVVRSIAHATPKGGKLLDQLIPISRQARVLIEQSDPMKVQIVNRSKAHAVARSIIAILGNPDRSALILSLAIEGKRLGVMVFLAQGKDRYTRENADLLSLVSEPLAIAMSNALKHQQVLVLKNMLTDDNRYLHQELRHLSGDAIIGHDFGLKGVFEMVRQVAPLNNPVLLLGETGTGKEVIANAIHYSSVRKDGPLIKVNCGAIPETLLDSELFGHEKGAFTGALTQKRGRFERAHKGTIFLDEIGDMPANAQVRLLRVVQNKEIERVGGAMPISVDIRIIAATHRNLESMVSSNQFREDLWFRLNVFPIIIPPLRQRKSDIPALVRHFIERKSREIGFKNPPLLAGGSIDRLMAYNWPGNVRELENVIERALVLSRDGILTFDHLALSRLNAKESKSSDRKGFKPLGEVMAGHIQKALSLTRGRINGPDGAARLLGINPSTLRNRMKKMGISCGRRK